MISVSFIKVGLISTTCQSLKFVQKNNASIRHSVASRDRPNATHVKRNPYTSKIPRGPQALIFSSIPNSTVSTPLAHRPRVQWTMAYLSLRHPSTVISSPIYTGVSVLSRPVPCSSLRSSVLSCDAWVKRRRDSGGKRRRASLDCYLVWYCTAAATFSLPITRVMARTQ